MKMWSLSQNFSVVFQKILWKEARERKPREIWKVPLKVKITFLQPTRNV